MKLFNFPSSKCPFPAYVWVGLAISLILSLFGVYKRNKVESHNKSVCIAAEYDTVAAFAAAQGISVPQALNLLKQDGLRGVVLSDDTIGSLASDGRLVLTSLTGSPGTAEEPGSWAVRINGNLTDMERARRGIADRFRNASVSAGFGRVYVTGISPTTLSTVSVGLDPNEAADVKASGLEIIGRMSNPVGIDGDGVSRMIAWAHDLGAQVFLPEGDQVLGRRLAEPDLIQALRINGMLYADPEFTKIGGNSEVILKAKDIVVRLHSAQVAELDKDTEAAAVERYVKAARERNMRILLVRQTNEAGPNVLNSYGEFIHTIAQHLVHEGDGLGAPRPFTEPSVPRLIYPLLGVSLAPAVFWLLTVFFPPLAIPGTVIVVLAGLAAYSPAERGPIAFIAALTYPILAFLSLEAYENGPLAWKYLRTCLISMAGGFFIAAMLSQLAYYIQAVEFHGVKAAVFIPVFIAFAYFMRKLAKANEHLKDPLTYSAILLGFVIIVVLGIMYMRTGNDNPAAVSPLELHMRNLLDHYLPVRPRTKSFAIGLPGLWIAIWLMDRWKKVSEDKKLRHGAWTSLAILAAMISQTDIVNTFCHIHTPVMLSAERICVELVLGAIVGCILLALGNLASKWGNKEAVQESGT